MGGEVRRVGLWAGRFVEVGSWADMFVEASYILGPWSSNWMSKWISSFICIMKRWSEIIGYRVLRFKQFRWNKVDWGESLFFYLYSCIVMSSPFLCVFGMMIVWLITRDQIMFQVILGTHRDRERAILRVLLWTIYNYLIYLWFLELVIKFMDMFICI